MCCVFGAITRMRSSSIPGMPPPAWLIACLTIISFCENWSPAPERSTAIVSWAPRKRSSAGKRRLKPTRTSLARPRWLPLSRTPAAVVDLALVPDHRAAEPVVTHHLDQRVHEVAVGVGHHDAQVVGLTVAVVEIRLAVLHRDDRPRVRPAGRELCRSAEAVGRLEVELDLGGPGLTGDRARPPPVALIRHRRAREGATVDRVEQSDAPSPNRGPSRSRRPHRPRRHPAPPGCESSPRNSVRRWPPGGSSPPPGVPPSAGTSSKVVRAARLK